MTKPNVPVVILCGGKGTRSYPFTEYFPTVMMPICGTPILVHPMRLYAEQGFDEFVLAAGHPKGYWQSMDISKGQQEMKAVHNGGLRAWMQLRSAEASAVSNENLR